MRIHLVIAACMPLVAIGAPADKAPVAPGATVACDVTLNVTDPDPKGLNVRAAPSTQGKIVAVLKPDGEWTSVHVTGQQGEWLSIDHAETIDDNAKDGSRTVLDKPGWVHISKLGISELFTGSGTVLREKPAADGKALLRIKDEDSVPTPLLACSGKYIKVRHGKVEGWTNTWCNNERTTCS
jgi:hypothetical protein